jgi:hypothetical protein
MRVPPERHEHRGQQLPRELDLRDRRVRAAGRALDDGVAGVPRRCREQRGAPGRGGARPRRSIGFGLRRQEQRVTTERVELAASAHVVTATGTRTGSISAASARYASALGDDGACSRTERPRPGASLTRTDYGTGGSSTSSP